MRNNNTHIAESFSGAESVVLRGDLLVQEPALVHACGLLGRGWIYSLLLNFSELLTGAPGAVRTVPYI